MKEERFVIYDNCEERTGGKRPRSKSYLAVFKNIKVIVMFTVKKNIFIPKALAIVPTKFVLAFLTK